MIVIKYLDQTTALYRKNYISTENFTSGIQNLFQTSPDPCVPCSFLFVEAVPQMKCDATATLNFSF